MTLSLRPIERTDAAALGAIHAGAWLGAYRGLMTDEFLDTITVERATARWSENLTHAELPQVRIALRDGVIVGFCAVATPSRDDDADGECAEIVALNVAPDAWRSGVGALLMNDALDGFRRAGWHAASLWVVDGNARAQAFYTRFGFGVDGASAVHEASGAHEVRMRLALPDAP